MFYNKFKFSISRLFIYNSNIYSHHPVFSLAKYDSSTQGRLFFLLLKS